MCAHASSCSGDPQLYINTHVRVLSGGFLSSWTFLSVFGLLVYRLCGHAIREVFAAQCLCRSGKGWQPQTSWGFEGLQGAVQSKGTPSHSNGEGNSWQLARRQSAEPPLVFPLLSFIPDSLLLFSFSLSFQSALLPPFFFPLHSSYNEPQPAATPSQGKSSHPCVSLIALDPFNNERE